MAAGSAWVWCDLDLARALLAHAEREGLVRWAEIRADHSAQLTQEVRIATELEGLGLMGLRPMHPTDAVYRGRAGTGQRRARQRGGLRGA